MSVVRSSYVTARRSRSLLRRRSETKWWRWWMPTTSLLLFLVCRRYWCYCSNAAVSRLRCPPARGSALLIILSTCCMCWALLWISGCHVCVLAGFRPYGMTQTWTKLNTTGCQEQERVRQQGEHVKRPDGFFIWRRWLGRTIGAKLEKWANVKWDYFA